MNRIYRLIFNRDLGVVQVASELASSQAGGRSTGRARPVRRQPLALTLVAVLGLAGMGAFADNAMAQSKVYYKEDTTITSSDTDIWKDKWVEVYGNDADGATVTIKGDGRLASVSSSAANGILNIGYWSDSKGSVIVDGSNASLFASQEIAIGRVGSLGGSIYVRNGGRVELGNTNGPRTYIYRNGLIEVRGENSRWLGGDMYVGYSDTYMPTSSDKKAQFIATEGAHVESENVVMYNGHASDGTWSSTLSGAGTTWDASGYLRAGDFLISDGAKMHVIADSTIWDDAKVDGEGSSLAIDGNLEVKGNGILSISNGASVSAVGGTVTLNSGALSIGGGANGTTLADPEAPGTLSAGSDIHFASGDAVFPTRLYFNHTADDYVFSNGIVSEKYFSNSYTGHITNLAGHTTLTGDLSKYLGVFTVSGGTLVLDTDVATGDLFNSDDAGVVAEEGGKLVVNGILNMGRTYVTSYYDSDDGITDEQMAFPGGILAGSGTINTVKTGKSVDTLSYIESVNVYAGGILSPGDGGVGKLIINGNLFLAAEPYFSDSIENTDVAAVHYDVDIKGDGTSDQVVVNGLTHIGAEATFSAGVQTADVRVNTLDAATSYQDGQQYTILTSAGGITGTFSGATTESAFLTPTLSYTDTSVLLKIALKDLGNPDHTVGSGEVYTYTDPVGVFIVNDGGTLAIGGNGVVGSLTSDDAITFASGSTYAVDIKGDGSSDKLTTTGKATLQGGTVEVTALDVQTSYQDGQTYSILQADGGVTGTFANSVSKSAFLSTSLDYADAKQVKLKIGLLDLGNPDHTVASGETYTSTGTVGKLDVLSGGTLAIGGKGTVGSLTSDDAITFASGSTYAVDIKGDGSSDKLTTTGKATLQGGTVEVTALDAQTSYQDGQTYSILSADGGVSGIFADAVSKSAFLNTSLDYADAKQVKLKIGVNGTGEGGNGNGDNGGEGSNGNGNGGNDGGTPPQIFQTVAQTTNQYATAVALNGLPQSGEALALYNALLLQSADSARAAFGSLSGEIYASNRDALLQDRFLVDAIAQRYTGTAPQASVSGATLWLSGSGSQMRLDARANTSKFISDRDGFAVGADWAFAERYSVGFAVGTEQLTSQIRAYDSRAKTDSIQYGAYAAGQWDGLSLRGGATYADYRVKTSRRAQVGDLVSQDLSSRHDADATTVFAEAGWDFAVSDALTLTPTLGVAHIWLDNDAFAETGGSTALAVDQSKDKYLVATAGLRANWKIAGPATLFASLAYQNASGDLKADSRQRFVAGGDAFTITGAPLAKNSGIAEIGVGVHTSARSFLSMGAHLQQGRDVRDVGAQFNWSVSF